MKFFLVNSSPYSSVTNGLLLSSFCLILTERSLKSCYQDEYPILASAIKERSGLYEKETDKRNPCIYFPSLVARLWTLDTRSSGGYFKQQNPFYQYQRSIRK